LKTRRAGSYRLEAFGRNALRNKMPRDSGKFAMDSLPVAQDD
jgi:hypothetical protein